MNDHRFIELLNLYVDEQIGPDEAAELEAEVLRHPARRRTYDQYCRLQRGCCMLVDSARSHAPASHGFVRSLREAERKIAASRRPAWRTAYTGMYGTAALAACVAMVLMVNRPASVHEGTVDSLAEAGRPVVVETPAPAVAVAMVQPPVTVSSSFDMQPALAATGLGVVRNAREAEIAANDREALEWMQRVELLPTQRVIVDDQTFEARATLQPDNRVFRSRHSIQGNAEFTAFQFQR